MNTPLRLLAAVALLGGSAGATTLTFEGLGTNTAIPNTFGDNITAAGTGYNVLNGATPNIDLTWSVAINGGSASAGWEFYNSGSTWSAAQLNDAMPNGLSVFSVTFTPTAGFGVVLNGFTFDPWGTEQHNFDWSIRRVSDNALMTGATTGVFSANTNVAINFTAADSAAYRLDIKRNSATPGSYNNGDSIAIDNLSFGQTLVAIPEPSTYGLLGAGALTVAAMIRRRRKVA